MTRHSIEIDCLHQTYSTTTRFMSIKKKSLFHFIGLNVLLIWMGSRKLSHSISVQSRITINIMPEQHQSCCQKYCALKCHMNMDHMRLITSAYTCFHLCVIIEALLKPKRKIVRTTASKLIKFYADFESIPYCRFIDVMFGLFSIYDATKMWGIHCVVVDFCFC